MTRKGVRIYLSPSMLARLSEIGLGEHEGYTGAFTRETAPGAISSGARIVKVATEEKDMQPIGAVGTVLGSSIFGDLGIMYFVEWDAMPKMAVSVIARKIKERRLTPHYHHPSTMHMGDCLICGNISDHPLHIGSPSSPGGRASLAPYRRGISK